MVGGDSTSDALYNPPGEIEQTQSYRTMYQYVNLSPEGGVERFAFLPRQYLLQTSDASDRGLLTLTMERTESDTRAVGANYVLAAQPILCAVSTGESQDTNAVTAGNFVLSQQAVDGNADRAEAAAFGAVIMQPGDSDKPSVKEESERRLAGNVVDSNCALTSASGTEPGCLDSLPSSDSLIADDIQGVSEARLLGTSGDATAEKGRSPVPEGQESEVQPTSQCPLDTDHTPSMTPSIQAPLQVGVSAASSCIGHKFNHISFIYIELSKTP